MEIRRRKINRWKGRGIKKWENRRARRSTKRKGRQDGSQMKAKRRTFRGRKTLKKTDGEDKMDGPGGVAADKRKEKARGKPVAEDAGRKGEGEEGKATGNRQKGEKKHGTKVDDGAESTSTKGKKQQTLPFAQVKPTVEDVKDMGRKKEGVTSIAGRFSDC
jgi:hypothetical protein